MEHFEINHLLKPVEQGMIVCHHYQSCATGFGLLKKQIENACFISRIQIACGFVSQYQPGLRQQRSANGDALVFTLR